MMTYLRHGLRKYFIWRWYNQYVLNSQIIQDDIRQTLKVRGSKAVSKPIDKQFDHVMLYYPEFALIFFWRQKNKKLFGKSLFLKNFNCKIFKSTDIKGGLMCYHPFATVINAKSIGKNFQFRNCLTIGNKNNDNSMIPVIGDNVIVGSNVVIIGDITVGNNVQIGAGAVVVKDVPSNCIVAGNPAKIIRTLSDG